jgi:predicted RNA binding protein YcfA (HicA-like mRNA interferase family)
MEAHRVRIINVVESTLLRVLRGTADANIRFSEPRSLLSRLGFAERIKGSHHIFTREDVAEILNLQPRNPMAKPYQVKQVRKVLVQYKLTEGNE